MSVFTVNEERFARALQDARERQAEGIGMLSEKLLHATLKNYFSGENGLQEQKVGQYYADVLTEDGIVEIQTGSCSPLRKKVERLLDAYPVTVVLPIMRRKKVFWIDPATGEAGKGRKSPHTGCFSDALPELLYLSDCFGREGFRALLFLYDGEEYKLRDGWGNGGKRGAHRVERVPTEPVDLMVLEDPYDCGALLPKGCPERFEREEFSKLTSLRGRNLWAALKLFVVCGVLAREKEGRKYVYTVLHKEFISNE